MEKYGKADVVAAVNDVDGLLEMMKVAEEEKDKGKLMVE